MSVGTWILSGYTPLALGAAASAVTGKLPRAGLAATLPAAVLGPAVASYTSVLLADTAVPAWHDAHRELPFVFAGSAVTAAGGLGMLAVRPDDAGQAVRFAVLGAAAELTAKSLLLRRLGPAAEPYQKGRAGTMMEAGEVLTAAGLAGAVLAGRSRAAAALSGAALMAASALTRFGVFEAGRASARDPKYTVGPQRQRLREQGEPASLTASGRRTQRPRRRARARTRASATTRARTAARTAVRGGQAPAVRSGGWGWRAGAVASTASASSACRRRRPCSENSSANDGPTITTAATNRTTIATRVVSGAPALLRVTAVPGSSTGYWATPQPQITAATPSAAMTRTPLRRRVAGGEQGQRRPGRTARRRSPAAAPAR